MIVECPGCRNRYDVTGRPAGTLARCRCGTTFPLPEPPATAGVLACPQCGAVAAPDRPACAYCGAVLAIASCPRCFGQIFVGAKHCQHCGAAVDVPARAAEHGEGPPLACPRCAAGGADSRLVANLVGETLLDECPTCGGLWLDTAALERVVAERQRQAALLAAGAGGAGDRRPAPASAGAPREPVVYLRCPECSTMMRRQNFGRRSGVIVDVCRPHGTWFDRDELRRIVEFVQAGGLEAAGRAEVEELRREVESKRQAIRDLGRGPAGGGWGDGGEWSEGRRFSLLELVVRFLFDPFR